MKTLQHLLHIREQEDDEIDDYDPGIYERERKVGLLILRAFRKCGLPVAEHESRHSGVRDKGDYSGYDVLYTEDDHEAMVTLEEATLEGLAKLHESGLIEGNCEITATREGGIRLTFKVHPNLHSGEAEID